MIDIMDKKIYIDQKLKLYTPKYVEILEALNNTFPIFSSYKILVEDKDTSETLNSLTAKITTEELEGINYRNFYEKNDTVLKYKIKTLHKLQELDWYHATTKDSWENIIKRDGLKPSGLQQLGSGLSSSLNMWIQDAVYLTCDYDYAKYFANIICLKRETDCVILKINGNSLIDFSKIIIDEDALRDNFSSALNYDWVDRQYPSFYTSLLKISNIGYRGNIPPSAIQLTEEVSFDSTIALADSEG